MNRVNTRLLPATVLAALGFSAGAGAQCAAPVRDDLLSAGHRVMALRVDKPGQAHVFAADGSTYTAAAVHRMHATLRHAERACDRGDVTEASKHLDDLHALLRR
jgi:hypothetical protein